MLKLTYIEIITRLIPESLLFIFAAYTFSGEKVDAKRYILSSIVLGICVFLIRMLPINYGVHTLLNLMVLTLITISINKIDVITAIRSSIITSIVLFTCEGLSVLILNLLYGETVQQLLSDPIAKAIYGIPSLVCFAITVTACYCYLNKKGRIKDVECRKDM